MQKDTIQCNKQTIHEKLPTRKCIFQALVYLWHGCFIRNGLSIAQDNFNISLAGSGAGTMYGSGLYLAESCTKADEYSRDEPGGYYENYFCMVLCRACLGKFYRTTQRDATAQGRFESGLFDSTFGRADFDSSPPT